MVKTTDPDTREINVRIDEMLKAGQAVNDEWAPMVQDAYDYLFGNQLAGTPVRDGWERIQINYLFPAMAQQMALMVQRKGLIIALPEEPGDVEVAAFWQGLLRWQFENELGMPAVALASTLDAWLYGYYVGKPYWEPRAEWMDDEKRWRGAPRVTLMRPDLFGADPDAEKADIGEAGYVYSRRRMLLSRAVERWSDQKDAIEEAAREDLEESDPIGTGFMAAREESRSDQVGEEPEKTRAAEARLVDIIRRARGYETEKSSATDEKTGLPRHVTVTEVYFHEGGTKSGQIEEPVPLDELVASGQVALDAMGTPRVAVEGGFGRAAGEMLDESVWPKRIVRQWKDEPLWPYGRNILRVGKDTILNPNPAKQRWPMKKWPYVVGVNMPLPHHWRGLNGVEMAKGLQDAVNIDAAHMSTYIKHFADPIVKVEVGAVEGDPENRKVASKLKSRAGAIWKLMKGGSLKATREAPPPMAQGLLEVYSLLTRELQDQTGMQEVARGRQAAGTPTATEIMELSRSSKVRTSMAAMLQDEWVAALMQLVADLDQRYMNPGDAVRVLGPKGERTLGQMPAENVRFDVKLSIGTALPYDQERKRQQLAELFKALGPEGYAILPEMLAAYELDNADEVLQRIQSWQAFQEFQKVQAAVAAQPMGMQPQGVTI